VNKILVVDGDRQIQDAIEAALADEDYMLLQAANGQAGLEILSREAVDLVIADLVMNGVGFLEQARLKLPDQRCIVMTGHATDDVLPQLLRQHLCSFLNKPFTADELNSAVEGALSGCPAAEAEVVSARPEWVELSVPCNLADVPPLQQLVTQLNPDAPREISEAVGFAFREMLNNAVEHGCKQDVTRRVAVGYVRFKRAIICWIKDPGDGFDPARLEHAAVSNPVDDPFRHVLAREAKGMRPGGFGLMVTDQLVDELVYNERHNELMFIKYLP